MTDRANKSAALCPTRTGKVSTRPPLTLSLPPPRKDFDQASRAPSSFQFKNHTAAKECDFNLNETSIHQTESKL